MPNPYQRRIIFVSTLKLQSFRGTVFLSRQLSKEQAEPETLALIRIPELLQLGANPRSLRVHDAVVYIRDGNIWTPDDENGNKLGTRATWFSMVLSILVFNTRSILDYHRGIAFSNAVETKNCYHIICFTDTWRTQHITDSGQFLPSSEVHRKNIPVDSGNTVHGGVLVAAT